MSKYFLPWLVGELFNILSYVQTNNVNSTKSHRLNVYQRGPHFVHRTS